MPAICPRFEGPCSTSLQALQDHLGHRQQGICSGRSGWIGATYIQVFQAKLPRSMDESVQQHQEAFKELCTATDLSLRTTKAMVQAIGKTMASLVVLEHHLWLNLTEIRDAEKMAFLNSPVSPKGLVRPCCGRVHGAHLL